MKTIPLKQIPVHKDLTFELDPQEDWLAKILASIFSEIDLDRQSFKGTLTLRQTNQIVNIRGLIHFTVNPLCAHCGQQITRQEKVSFVAHQSPAPKQAGATNAEDDSPLEKETAHDDLDFGYYKNEEVRIDTMINDEIALKLPFNYYCEDTATCHLAPPDDTHITLNDRTDPRWAPLKDLKNPKH